MILPFPRYVVSIATGLLGYLFTTNRKFHKHSIWNVLNLGFFLKNPKLSDLAEKIEQRKF